MDPIMRSGYSDMPTGLQDMPVTDGHKGHRQVVLECLARMTDGIKNKNKEAEVKVYDLAEMIAKDMGI
jgi:hypothetical protein